MAITMDPTTKPPTKRRAEAVVARRADRRAQREAVKRRVHSYLRGPMVDGPALFDHQARRALGISGDEFLRRWDSGHYRGADRDEAREASRLALLLPFVRRTPA